MPKVQRKVSLQRILLIALLVVVLIQGLLPLSALVASGVRETLENNAVEVDTHMVDNRKVTLQSAMTTQWNGIAKESTYLNSQLEAFFSQNHVDMNAFLASKDLQRAYTAQVYPEILDYSRRDQTCGDFLVLANDANTDSAATYEGVFLRDSEPTTIADSNSDLLLERGDTSLARQQTISLDSPWMPSTLRATATALPMISSTNLILLPSSTRTSTPRAWDTGRCRLCWRALRPTTMR